jgi:hypothetical protein
MGFGDELAQGESNAAAADLRRFAELKQLRAALRRYAWSGIRESQH